MSGNFTFVVVGGGIAGISCVENLGTLCPEESILLVSSSPIVKSVKNFKQLTRNLEEFDVCEKSSTELRNQFPNVTVVHQDVINFDPIKKKVGLSDGSEYFYKKLCICTGASPKVIANNSDFIVGIRDTETVCAFEKRLSNAKRVIVAGNGGIATELVFKIQCCEVLWAIKDDSIISTFIDPGASRFLLPHMIGEGAAEDTVIKRIKYSIEGDSGKNKRESNNLGCALGPDWTDILKAEGKQTIAVGSSGNRMVSIEYKVEITELISREELESRDIYPRSLSRECDESQWPVYVKLTNGKVYGCDFIVSATGVVPNVSPFTQFARFKTGIDGGLEVDDRMKTSVDDVFAAGDVCTAAWKHSPYWLQMRLWSQARQMGHHAAECMVAELRNRTDPLHSDFCFELFAHVTKFFNYKVILLGRFNGQGLDNNYKLLIKVIEGEQYVKVVLKDGKMVGAILIGETDLEETFENLILNQLDLTSYGDDLLDHDIEDYFD